MMLTPFDYWLPPPQPRSQQKTRAISDVNFNEVFEHIFNPKPKPKPEPVNRKPRLDMLAQRPTWTTHEFAKALRISQAASYEWLWRAVRRGEARCIQHFTRHPGGHVLPNLWAPVSLPEK